MMKTAAEVTAGGYTSLSPKARAAPGLQYSSAHGRGSSCTLGHLFSPHVPRAVLGIEPKASCLLDQLDFITRIPKHPDLTIGQKHYLCSIAKIYNVNYLRTLMKKQYLYVIQRNSQKPGRSRLYSCYSQKQHYPCTTWRHQLEREDSPSIAAVSTPEMIIQHSLWRPVRNKEGLKTGYASKIRCKSLKIFRRPGRLCMQPVSSNDSESHMNEEKKEEDILNKCMQSMSIEEQGEHVMLT
ncbi:protein FAM216A isoform X4 [Sciurus carolinensis]|uniref:protein FAM216A isoform X4 n=1 Tax=Sciurus carolinensis TaxID=30640 RepID=UPI001FB5679B|nr:protein FAM216A isoform X4 [Sciurus carolinensis]